MNLRKTLFTTLLFYIWGSGVNAQTNQIQVNSPDQQIRATVQVIDSKLSYFVSCKGSIVLKPSRLGLITDSIDLGDGAKFSSLPERSKIDEKYAILSSHPIAYNKANEAKIPIETKGKIFNLYVRVYNDGVAIRYSLPKGTKRIDGEATSWELPDNSIKVAWSEPNPGYEGLSHVTTFAKVPHDIYLMGPLTIQAGQFFLSLSEADCENFSDMGFAKSSGGFKVSFPFAKQGWEIKELGDQNPLALKGLYKGEKVSPWRTTIIAGNLTGLVNSNLLTNLCPSPAKGADFSWVKPGRCMWQWWSVGAPKYDDQKNWYDAAAKLKWEYYLVDDGWRNWRQPNKDQWQLLKEAIGYGKSVGVKSIVWVDSKEFRIASQRRAYLERIKAVGADGIKIDFIPAATDQIMQWYMGTMQDCAELKLLLNFHGSVKPTGLTRTYPNDITREAVRGNEYHMSRYKRVAPLEQDVTLSFTRLMAGAADVTPVILNPKELSTAQYTWAHEFAQSIVFLSPITHFCDNYKFYIESPLFDLFQQIPTVWDETQVLSCTEIGQVVAYARRKDKTWWIGVMNGTSEKEVKIPLSFLKDKTNATLVYDSKESNASIQRKEQDVSPKDILTVKMAPGGGFVARVK